MRGDRRLCTDFQLTQKLLFPCQLALLGHGCLLLLLQLGLVPIGHSTV